MCLSEAEITAITNKNPQRHYNDLTKRFAEPITAVPRIHLSTSRNLHCLSYQKTLLNLVCW